MDCVQGFYATSSGEGGFGDQRQCEAGHFCLGGMKTPCPAGRYGKGRGLVDPQCSGQCAQGYYCPQGSAREDEKDCGGAEVRQASQRQKQ